MDSNVRMGLDKRCQGVVRVYIRLCVCIIILAETYPVAEVNRAVREEEVQRRRFDPLGLDVGD